jgi:hypothetical protein
VTVKKVMVILGGEDGKSEKVVMTQEWERNQERSQRKEELTLLQQQ